MKLIIKGFIIGLGKIMPGVSGAMLAITLNEYNRIIENIANIQEDFYKKSKYLAKIGFGIVLAIILMSKIIVKCLNIYYFPTILLFCGIVSSGIIKIAKKTTKEKKDIILSISIITIFLIILKIFRINKYNTSEYNILEFIKLTGIGVLDAISSIVPGISGTALLMYFGYYSKIMNTFATILDKKNILQNICVLIPFIIGFILGTLGISKILNKLLKNRPNTINTTVVILMIHTLITLIVNAFKVLPNTNQMFIGIILFVIPILTSIKK